jgi:hypothetical protein
LKSNPTEAFFGSAGTSRSGVTISSGMLGGLDRQTAARFSFLLSLPAVAAAGLLEAWQERAAIFGSTEAITMAGQLAIRWIGQDINAYMNKISKTEGVDYVVASDTDSVYLRFGPLVDLVKMPIATPEDKAKVVQYIQNLKKLCLLYISLRKANNKKN